MLAVARKPILVSKQLMLMRVKKEDWTSSEYENWDRLRLDEGKINDFN